MCMVLPEVIESVVAKGGDVKVPHDTVAEELKKIAEISGEKSENLAMALAVYTYSSDTFMRNLLTIIRWIPCNIL